MGEAKKPQAQRVGDFEIVREIGRGGMGIVYEARQVSLNRRVALKVLGGGLGLTLSPKAVLRFRREAEAAAKLHHTNIVPIYATGEQDGTHYYAMELVEGPSLNLVVAALKETSKRQNVETSKSEPWAPARGQSEPQATKRPLTPSVKGRLCEEATKEKGDGGTKGRRDEGYQYRDREGAGKEPDKATRGNVETSKRRNVDIGAVGASPRTADTAADQSRDREGAAENRHEGDEPRASARADHDASTMTSTATRTCLPAWVEQTLTLDHTAAPRPDGSSASSSALHFGAGYFDAVARLIAEVADALDYAHKQGVIHRDIKPSNLLLSPAGRLSINDFGLARVLEQPGMTLTGEFVGTPTYMSPEQIAAGRAPLDHRTDIYSLGATLYEMLTLRPPFLGPRRDQIIAQIISKDPRPPRSIDRHVPMDLETICLKAMEKDPDRRYQSGGDLAEDLRRYLNRFAISARRAGPLARTVKWCRRRPAVAALLVAVVFLSAVAAGLAYRSSVVAEQARVAKEQARAAEGQRALDQAVVEVLYGRWDRVEPLLEDAEVNGIDPGRIRVLRGLAAVEQVKIDTAIHELNLALQHMPDSLAAYALLYRAYNETGQLDQAQALIPRLLSLIPVTPEDYLWGSWAIEGFWFERSLEWMEHLGAQHPTPAVYYKLGRARVEDLADTYDPKAIEPALDAINAARTQMPGYARAVLFHVWADLVAADIRRLAGDQAASDLHLQRARRDAGALLVQQPEDAQAHLTAAYVAMFERRWEEALQHARDEQGCRNAWPFERYDLPLLNYRLRRYEDALAELEAMPQALRASPRWFYYYVLVGTELRGVDAALAVLREYEQRPVIIAASAIDERHNLYRSYCLLGRRTEAVRATREHVGDCFPLQPEQTYLLSADLYTSGELDDAALLRAATKRCERLDAQELIAMTHLADGRRDVAIQHLEAIERAGNWVWRNGQYELGWGELILERLREDPTWPPWIPLKQGTEGPLTPSVKDRLRDEGTE